MADVTVTFGANTSDLVAEMAVAQRELRLATQQMNAYAAQVVRGGENQDVARVALESWSSEVGHAQQKVAALRKELSEGGGAGGALLNTAQMQESVHVVKSIFDDLAAGQTPLRSFATEGGRIGQIFAGMSSEARATVASFGLFGVAVLAAGAAIAVLIKNLEDAGKTQQSFQRALDLSGAKDAAKADLDEITGALREVGGAGADTAQKIADSFAGLQNSSGPLIAAIGNLTAGFAHLQGADAADTAKQLQDIFARPLDALEKLRAAYPALTAAQLANYTVATQTHNAAQAQAAIVNILTQELQREAQTATGARSVHASLTQSLAAVSVAESSLGGVSTNLVEVQNLLSDASQHNRDRLNDVAAAAKSAAGQLGGLLSVARENAAVDVIKNLGQTPTGQLSGLQSQLASINQQMSDIRQNSDNFRNGDFIDPSVKTQYRELGEELAQVQDRITALREQQSGGSPTQLTDLDQARASLSLGQDDLRAAQARAAALRQEAAETTDKTRQTQLATQAAQAELAVKMQELELTKARNSLSKTRGDTGATGELAEARANQAAIDQVYAAGSAQRIEAENEVLAAQKQADNERKQEAEATENEIYTRKLGAANESIKLIQEEARQRGVGLQQELGALKGALDQRLQLQEAHFKKIEQLYGEGTSQFRAAQQDIVKAQTQTTAELQTATQQAANQMRQSYEKVFSTINSAFDSQISGLLKGTTSWGQAFKNILTSLTVDIIKFFVNWGLQATENEALQIVGIGRVTLAQQTASAAQISAQSSAAAAGSAVSATSILSTLVNDAKATFGGVFAFLAPTLGPAAAAPAAAAGATVAAGGSFASGSWELPSDMLANVHQGEMIVPASHTSWAQSLMANAAGSGSNSSNYNASMTNHFHGSFDEKQISNYLSKNGAKIMRSLSRKNPNFRP